MTSANVLSWGLTIGTIVLIYFGATFILYELAFDKKKGKTADGKWQIKIDGFVINRFYNMHPVVPWSDKKIPKNICQLFWRIFLLLVPSSIVFLAISLWWLVVTFVASLIGLYPEKALRFDYSKKWFSLGSQKKWFAPWVAILPCLVLYAAIAKNNFAVAFFSVAHITFFVIYLIVVVVGVCAIFYVSYQLLMSTNPLTASMAFIKDYKEKKCTLIYDPKEEELSTA